MNFHKVFVLILSLFMTTLIGCTNRKAETLLYNSGYPKAVDDIMVKKCATAGCHNDQSAQNAGGLNLSTWHHLFEGGNGNAVVIPFRADFSTLCYYINTDTAKGPVLQPRMPYNASPLSDTEYETIRSWIENGAADDQGFVKFSDHDTKSKLYICNRGCDVVTVLDPVSGLAMRYVDVGNSSEIEGPVMVKVSPDQLYWYVIFTQGNVIQKFRTSDNVKVGELHVGQGIWSSLSITSDSKYAFISNADIHGRIACVNVESMQLIKMYEQGLRYPHGLCINQANNQLYATSKEGNFMYRIDVSDMLNPVVHEVCLETNTPVYIYSSLDPYRILFSKDESVYYVTCLKSSELRMMQTSNDSLLAVYATGSNPTEMVLTADGTKIFLSCLGVPGTNKKSVINIFDCNSRSFLPELYAGHDSKGIVIDENAHKLFVANRNVSAGGPAAHHAPLCAGKNGYLTAIDLNTMMLIPGFKAELSVDPYFIAR